MNGAYIGAMVRARHASPLFASVFGTDETNVPRPNYTGSMLDVVIRRPEPQEHDSVRALVQTVVDEIYGGLWAPPPLPVGEENWGLAWVAAVDATLAGMVLTHEEWISDLWVLRRHRGCGIGRRLLARGETEIVNRGYRTLRLRVLQWNTAAIAFYDRQGWQAARAFPHEKFPVTVLEMVKSASGVEKNGMDS